MQFLAKPTSGPGLGSALTDQRREIEPVAKAMIEKAAVAQQVYAHADQKGKISSKAGSDQRKKT